MHEEELTGELCCVCSLKLTVPFPEDYPKDWMFCCICIQIAELFIKESWNGETSFLWGDYTVNRIIRKINLIS